MTIKKIFKVMWLINHTTLRKFEVEQLRNLGVQEIFMPKSFPYDEGNLSANVTYEFDQFLGLKSSELDVLNRQDWYGEPEIEAWEIANNYFDMVFVAFFPRQLLSTCRHFNGAIILRPFGLCVEESYSNMIRQIEGVSLELAIKRVGKRFTFGMAYDHLSRNEDSYIANRAVFLPTGLKHVNFLDQWKGEDEVVFFVCPRINSSPDFNQIYRNFKNDFKCFPYKVGGAQPICVDDPNVLGYVSNDEHAHNMTQSRVMFYHSQEPNHIHYHPFEAVQAGMPLIFMAGGMLDFLGGKSLPGRCKNISEAKKKIKRILKGDKKLIENIRNSQLVLLKPMDPKNCAQDWQSGFHRIASQLEAWQNESLRRPFIKQRKKVAVILPLAYRGGTLRGCLELVKALALGSRYCDEEAEIVLGHLDDGSYLDDDFYDLPDNVSIRPYVWKTLSINEAKNAMYYAGFESWRPTSDQYLIPDDGINHFYDCDLMLFVSDRLHEPLLPVKPMLLMVYDYIQRYIDFMPDDVNQAFLKFARSCERVFVTTEFTKQDALQYAGLDSGRVVKLPMLVSDFSVQNRGKTESAYDGEFYFIWTTNAALHKNHQHALEALQIYYEELDGQWNCKVTGVDAESILDIPHLSSIAGHIRSNKALRQRINFLGELPDDKYRRTLKKARFLWHPVTIGNRAFSVIEAAFSGVPALSSDHPAMREINKQYGLNLAWMDSSSPKNMARKLKEMEQIYLNKKNSLPDEKQLEVHSTRNYARTYWQEVCKCL